MGAYAMEIITIEHEEYPSVIAIEYNSLYRNEILNFIHNIKIKENKEEVFIEPFFNKIIYTNNKNIGLLTIDGRIEGYYYINKDNILKYIYISYPYRRNGFGKVLIAHALKANSNLQFDKSDNQAYNRLISSPIFEDAFKATSTENKDGKEFESSFDDSNSNKGELTLF